MVLELEMDTNETKLSLCQPCLLDDESKMACAFCVDCVEGLCDNCMSDHRKNKASRNHGVMKIADDKDKTEVFNCLNKIFKCPEHPDADLALYCGTHKHYICSICLSTSDRGCEEVSGENIAQLDLSVTKEMSDMLDREIKCFQSKRSTNAGLLRNRCECIADQRKKIVQKLHEEVDDLDRKLARETEQLLTAELDTIYIDLKTCDGIEARQNALLNIISNVENTGMTNKSQLLRHGIVGNILGLMKNIPERRTTQIEFTEAVNAPVSLGTVMIVDFEAEMGSACTDSVDGAKNSETKCLKSSDIKAGEAKSEILPTAESCCTFFKKYTMSKEKEMSCITAIVSLGRNGLLIAADKANKMLRIFNGEGEQTATVPLGFTPLCMCEDHHIPDKGVVVAFTDVNKILFYEIHINGGFKNGHFHSMGKVQDITRFETGVALLVSFAMECEIEIRRRNGQILQRFVCKNASNLLYIKTGQFVIYSGNKLQCLNKYTDKRCNYKEYGIENKMNGVTGLAADEDNVYVCCKGSQNIHQVCANDFRNYRVILRNLVGVSAIANDKSKKILFVGFVDSDEISSFKL